LEVEAEVLQECGQTGSVSKKLAAVVEAVERRQMMTLGEEVFVAVVQMIVVLQVEVTAAQIVQLHLVKVMMAAEVVAVEFEAGRVAIVEAGEVVVVAGAYIWMRSEERYHHMFAAHYCHC
jgi:hypothetical protein